MNDKQIKLTKKDEETLKKISQWTEKDWEKYRQERDQKEENFKKKGIVCFDDSIESSLADMEWLIARYKD